VKLAFRPSLYGRSLYTFPLHRQRDFLKFKIVLAFRAFFGKIHPSMGPG
jgi:hypothetical protein